MTPALPEAINAPTAYMASGVRAWTGKTLRSQDWLVPIPPQVEAEIEAAVAALRRKPADTLSITPDEFPLSATKGLMSRIKRMLDEGSGFAVLDRCSVNRFDKGELKAVYWLLSQMIARPVPQSFTGTMLHDVVNTGKKMGTRVRGDLTDQEINWHTDNGFNEPPRYFGLAVLQTAREGGESRAVNLITAHNVLRDRSPELAARLYRPFRWSRLGEHAEGDSLTSLHPIYSQRLTTLVSRLNRRVIHVGHETAGEPLDDLGREAIDALYAILDEPGFAFSYQLQPGQFQWMNNLALAHHRTRFIDWEEEHRRRHLVRIYLRDSGKPTYLG